MKQLLSIASFLAAIILALVGMWMPPQGEISPSVLILVAQLLVLCATMLGIKVPQLKPPPSPPKEG